MKKLLSIALILVSLLAAAAAAEEIDVTGFWYSEEDGSGFELEDGVAIFSDEDGEETEEGTYTADGPNVTIEAEGRTLQGVVSGNSLIIEDSGKAYVRDGIEAGYWYNDADDSAFELSDGEVWMYSADGEVVGEGTYAMDGSDVTIVIDGKTMTGSIVDGEMTLDGVLYTLL